MKAENSKLVLGLLAGAAIGAAVAYLLTTDKKEQWIESANSLLGKAKNGFKDLTDSIMEVADTTTCNSKAPEVNEAKESETVITE